MTDQISSNIINSLKLSRSTLFYLALAILLGCLTYLSFAERVKQLQYSIHNMIKDLVLKGNTIYAYGAPVKGSVMMNYCNIDSSLIPLAVEVNKEKIGKYIPGVDVKVVDELSVEEPDYYFLLSWNFLEVFKKSKEFKSGKRKFIVPVPEPRIVSKEY